jgi:hypothetical protein
MVDKVTPYAAAATEVEVAGQSVIVAYAQALGGVIANPSSATEQGIAVVEVLFYSFVGDATPYESPTTFPLQPGDSVKIPANSVYPVSVNALTAGHKFSAYIIQPAPVYPPDPVPGTFPPAASTALQKIIPSYLYEQYKDDEDLQAFVRAYNESQQQYLDWFNQAGLPIYTGSLIAGALLDWVAEGLYGMKRPTLASGSNQDLGPFNTVMFNQLMFNEVTYVGADNITATNDDIFKRIMTWRLYRGDGKIFNVYWLKRRIIRFLNYPNGGSGIIDNTYPVAVSFDTGNIVNIFLPPVPNATTLKEAIESGSVELPFQFSFNVVITP